MLSDQHITNQELLDLLPLVADQQWSKAYGAAIRNQDGACPICAIVNEINGERKFTTDAFAALNTLGVYFGYGHFVLAADVKEYDSHQVREQMLQILHVDA